MGNNEPPASSAPEVDEDNGEPSSFHNYESLRPEQNIEIDRKNLEIVKHVENRLFNIIQKGKLTMANPRNENEKNNRLDVVVKSVLNQEDTKQQRMILDELQVLIEVKKHPNITALIGYVAIPPKNQLLIVIENTEERGLLEHLRNCKEQGNFKNQLVCSELDENGYVFLPTLKQKTGMYSNAEISESLNTLVTFDLLSFGYQIANGMKYLMDCSYLHRQLALRSIFITSNKTIRIGDFGLARKRDIKEYYRIIHKDLPLSHHWMAPETFNDHKFTEKSDIWSFGVCLWELFTLGTMPYEGVQEMLTYLKRGRRLKEPEYCHKEIYDFMLTCWNMDPNLRPTFSMCLDFFKSHLDKYAPEIRRQIDEKLQSTLEHQKELVNWTQ